MVKQEIYKINDFFNSCQVEKPIYFYKCVGTDTRLHQSEKQIDINFAIQPQHITVSKKRQKIHYIILNPSQKFQQQPVGLLKLKQGWIAWFNVRDRYCSDTNLKLHVSLVPFTKQTVCFVLSTKHQLAGIVKQKARHSPKNRGRVA